jgi:hypothetical protein
MMALFDTMAPMALTSRDTMALKRKAAARRLA